MEVRFLEGLSVSLVSDVHLLYLYFGKNNLHNWLLEFPFAGGPCSSPLRKYT